MILHDFDPLLIDFGFIQIRWYSISYILGIVLGWVYAKKIIKNITIKHNFLAIKQKEFDDLIFYLILGIIIGGRLGYVIIYNAEYYLKNLEEILMIWHGGMSFHGGLLGVIVATLLYSKKKQGLSNYLTANRNVGTISLTTSLVASALGAWILFGPASAATWGGIGSVIGYSLGTAFPMIAFIFLGTKIRKVFPKGNTITEFIYHKFGKNLFKLVLILVIFYMFIFLCAEVTAISMLVNYISGTPLWLTASLVIVTTLTYTLYGGLRASILTDNIQFFIVITLLFISLYYLFFLNAANLSFEDIQTNSSHLLSLQYIPNYTAGLTFFIAVAATNLFHQGNWQRIFAAKDNEVLKKSLLFSFIIIIPIVFFMGICGIIAISIDGKVNPDGT